MSAVPVYVGYRAQLHRQWFPRKEESTPVRIIFSAIFILLIAALRFAFDDCANPREKRRYLRFADIPLGLDVLQYMLQPFAHADRAMDETKREGKQGYRFYHD